MLKQFYMIFKKLVLFFRTWHFHFIFDFLLPQSSSCAIEYYVSKLKNRFQASTRFTVWNLNQECYLKEPQITYFATMYILQLNQINLLLTPFYVHKIQFISNKLRPSVNERLKIKNQRFLNFLPYWYRSYLFAASTCIE